MYVLLKKCIIMKIDSFDFYRVHENTFLQFLCHFHWNLKIQKRFFGVQLFFLMLCCQKLGEKTTITKYCRTCTLKFMKKWMKRYKYHILNIKQVNLMILISIRRQALKEFRLKKNFSWPFLFVFFLSLWHAAFVMYCQRHHTGRESVLPGPPPPTGVS